MARVLTTATLSLLPLFGCMDDSHLQSHGRPVIGGDVTPEGLYLATGALVMEMPPGVPPSLLCTGTLVAPDVVLTAAHCVDSESAPPGLHFTLVLDVETATAADLVASAQTYAHPQFDYENVPPGLGKVYDVGVMLLVAPILDVPYEILPSPEEATSLAEDLDTEIVGYGLTDASASEAGVKNHATTTLAEVGEWELLIAEPGQPQNCMGDSGGPAFIDIGTGGARRLVGVVSRGPEGGEVSCDLGGIDTRVDKYLDWIHSVADIPCGSGLSPPCGQVDAGPEPDAAPDASQPDASAQPDAGVQPDAGNNEGDGDGTGCGCRIDDRPTSIPGGVLVLLLCILIGFRRGTRSTRAVPRCQK